MEQIMKIDYEYSDTKMNDNSEEKIILKVIYDEDKFIMIKIYKKILMEQSEYFKSMFENNWVEQNKDYIELDITCLEYILEEKHIMFIFDYMVLNYNIKNKSHIKNNDKRINLFKKNPFNGKKININYLFDIDEEMEYNKKISEYLTDDGDDDDSDDGDDDGDDDDSDDDSDDGNNDYINNKLIGEYTNIESNYEYMYVWDNKYSVEIYEFYLLAILVNYLQISEIRNDLDEYISNYMFLLEKLNYFKNKDIPYLNNNIINDILYEKLEINIYSNGNLIIHKHIFMMHLYYLRLNRLLNEFIENIDGILRMNIIFNNDLAIIYNIINNIDKLVYINKYLAVDALDDYNRRFTTIHYFKTANSTAYTSKNSLVKILEKEYIDLSKKKEELLEYVNKIVNDEVITNYTLNQIIELEAKLKKYDVKFELDAFKYRDEIKYEKHKQCDQIYPVIYDTKEDPYITNLLVRKNLEIGDSLMCDYNMFLDRYNKYFGDKFGNIFELCELYDFKLVISGSFIFDLIDTINEIPQKISHIDIVCNNNYGIKYILEYFSKYNPIYAKYASCFTIHIADYEYEIIVSKKTNINSRTISSDTPGSFGFYYNGDTIYCSPDDLYMFKTRQKYINEDDGIIDIYTLLIKSFDIGYVENIKNNNINEGKILLSTLQNSDEIFNCLTLIDFINMIKNYKYKFIEREIKNRLSKHYNIKDVKCNYKELFK
jgi:hypothetical protein